MMTLTHSSLAIRVRVDLSIVLNDGQAGGNGRHHLILAIFWTGAAGGLLTTAIVAIEHPERVSPLTLQTWGAFSLYNQENGKKDNGLWMSAIIQGCNWSTSANNYLYILCLPFYNTAKTENLKQMTEKWKSTDIWVFYLR